MVRDPRDDVSQRCGAVPYTRRDCDRALLPAQHRVSYLTEDRAGVRGIKPEFRDLWAPFEVCQERIAGQFERNEISASECRTRIKMLKVCWRPPPPGTEG